MFGHFHQGHFVGMAILGIEFECFVVHSFTPLASFTFLLLLALKVIAKASLLFYPCLFHMSSCIPC